ncbi:hypothetical protein DEIPH_ctg019orf0029 [Deinococcus phoenicis]|uniref:HTH marR-type domain-containing protein n=1 Tax=Deinococcus phoenicis TaxID=1476583 RepID=A0A016QS77_9DEIO|nr:hypothetical protein DEIPH_ctg019orf0029 [Deinococcus phoenicis]
MSQFKRRLQQEVPLGELTSPQLAVLRHLAGVQTATISGLARLEGIKPQSMGGTVAGLEAAGLLASQPDPTDKRQRLFAMTPQAQAMIETMHTSREDWLAQALERNLSPEEQHRLSEAIPLLQHLLQTP